MVFEGVPTIFSRCILFLFQREYCYGLKSVVKPSSRKSGHGYAIFSLTIDKLNAKTCVEILYYHYLKKSRFLVTDDHFLFISWNRHSIL